MNERKQVHKTPKVVAALIARDGQRCHYCAINLMPSQGGYNSNGWSVDHIIPRSKGGTNQLDNLVLACRRCNSLRKDRSYFEFRLKQETDFFIRFIMGEY